MKKADCTRGTLVHIKNGVGGRLDIANTYRIITVAGRDCYVENTTTGTRLRIYHGRLVPASKEAEHDEP